MSEARHFVHPDGRTYGIEVVDFRVREHWTTPRGGGGGNTSTRDDAADAQKHAGAKAKELLRKGFVEGEPRKSVGADRSADVIDAFHSNLDYAGKRRDDFQPTDTKHLWTSKNISVQQWLVTSDDRRLGIKLLALAKTPREMGEAVAQEMLRHRDEILADTEKPSRKLSFEKPVGRFTHLVVLSPAVTNQSISRNVNIENPIISRSVFRVFPAFDCEMSGDETPGLADARTTGHGCIPTGNWSRDPHPVFDLAYPKARGPLKFLVFEPKELERRLGPVTLAKLEVPEIHARNYRGEVRRFAKGDSPDLASLRAFFGFDA